MRGFTSMEEQPEHGHGSSRAPEPVEQDTRYKAYETKGYRQRGRAHASRHDAVSSGRPELNWREAHVSGVTSYSPRSAAHNRRSKRPWRRTTQEVSA